jgi:acyl-CoA thioester hydrolase
MKTAKMAATENGSFIEHVTDIRVRYADTDQMGIVYYGKYFEYFEVARTELLRACGLPYKAIESAGYGLPVTEASAKYLRSARYDDLLSITARIPKSIGSRLEIDYSVNLENTGELIAEGRTILVFVLSATGKPSRPPEIYRKALNRFSNPL